jgi:hypothetical protein
MKTNSWLDDLLSTIYTSPSDPQTNYLQSELVAFSTLNFRIATLPLPFMSTSENGAVLNTFGRRNKKLRKTGDYFDFVIECRSRQFKVHRAIICPQSSFLESLCVSKFKVIAPPPILAPTADLGARKELRGRHR